MNSRDVWITGIGILSCAGEGAVAHGPAAICLDPRYDQTRFAPYSIHPLCSVDFSKQIAKTSEQKQMGLWQRIGVYAAGLALADANLSEQTAILNRTHLIVAAGNGERDCQFDSKVLDSGADAGASLNLALLSGLRPTLYLGELSNLLAGNISIVHHVTGSSRTFKGEETAAVSAIENAHRRISSGEGDVFLVGGALNAEREDLMLGYELENRLWPHAPAPVWSRKAQGGGIVLGSAGAFLVLEAREHAERRGQKPYACIRAVVTDRCERKPGDAIRTLETLFGTLNVPECPLAVMSGASGVEPITSDELAFLQGLEERGYQVAIRAHGTMIGHSVEATFSAGVCLSALALSNGQFFAPFSDNWVETPFECDLDRILLTGVGHWCGEGLALIERVH